MNSFYKNIGLSDHLNFNIEMDKSEFVASLKKITYKTNTTFISIVPDNGIPSRFEYRGIVNKDNFIIKRRLHFFDFNVLHCVIKGNISEENHKTLVSVEFVPFFTHLIALLFVPLISSLIAIQLVKKPIIISSLLYQLF